MRPIVGRADLLRCLTSAEAGDADRLASILGYAADAAPAKSQLSGFDPARLAAASKSRERMRQGSSENLEQGERPSTFFWRPSSYRSLGEALDDRSIEDMGAITWDTRPAERPGFIPLAEWRALGPQLRASANRRCELGAVDAVRVAEAIGKGRPLRRLPFERRRCWPANLQLVMDRSDSLMPFWRDGDLVAFRLQRLLGSAVEMATIDEADPPPRLLGRARPYRLPPAGGVVLVLSDLGAYDDGGGDRTAFWLRFGREIRAAGCVPLVLFPGPRARCPPVLRRLWRMVEWERSSHLPQDGLARKRRAERLLALLAGAVRIEPGLLRAARRLLPADEADAGTEIDAWFHSDIESRHPVGATPVRGSSREITTGIERPELVARAVALRRLWRQPLPAELWFLELLSMPEPLRSTLDEPAELDRARAFFAGLAERSGEVAGGVETWLGQAARLASPTAWEVSEFVKAAGPVALRDPDFLPPRPIDPLAIPMSGPGGQVDLRQVGDKLVAAPRTWSNGSLIGSLRSANGLLQVREVGEGRGERIPLWADDAGIDAFGRWASFRVKDVVTRLRWIPPGSFMMGSVPREEGRDSDEVPRHHVTIAEGFWLMEAPVTQSLWRAVMGNNPSNFKGPARPVESVSFKDANRFIATLNGLVEGLDLELPSEAKWEYACRAGGLDARYGDLGEIAWYYPNSNRRTHDVANMRPNAFGLYDMLGNVWEWCLDQYQHSYNGVPDNGRAVLREGYFGYRVVRGGCWGNTAPHVRAAYRNLFDEPHRGKDLGFRCAMTQVEDEGRVTPRQASPADVQFMRTDGGSSVTLTRMPGIIIRSDREELNLDSFTLANCPWASGMGRDRFGLYADFTLPGTKVTQRLRWIPPGRFMMGSPPDEPGRDENEGPRHSVTIAEGFWLMDTPVSQELWEAVMGRDANKSEFRSPRRPVDMVSFEDAQAFINAINAQFPGVDGLDLTLPSEAQWEYACRAGTETATWAGAMEIRGRNNAPILDAIAWYSGNAGKDFDLPNGYDVAGWVEKQYDFPKSGTRRIATKRANPWGLYDMLGNVAEWCLDLRHETYDGAPDDGSAWFTGGDDMRVTRGGSWINFASEVRSAHREFSGESNESDDVGFRCARVQVKGDITRDEEQGRGTAVKSKKARRR